MSGSSRGGTRTTSSAIAWRCCGAATACGRNCPAPPWSVGSIPVRSTICRRSRASSTALSPGVTSARRRGPGSCTSPPAAARRTLRSARNWDSRSWRRSMNSASSRSGMAGCPAGTSTRSARPSGTIWKSAACSTGRRNTRTATRSAGGAGASWSSDSSTSGSSRWIRSAPPSWRSRRRSAGCPSSAWNGNWTGSRTCTTG